MVPEKLPPVDTTKYPNALPPSRLGISHTSLNDFQNAVQKTPTSKKLYTLIVVTESSNILLGLKHRGFGKGFYNSFGGKVEESETIDEGALRELNEETGIVVTRAQMREARIGQLHFTFDDNGKEMLVYLYRIKVTFEQGPAEKGCIAIDKNAIRGCDEITPEWMKQERIPFQKMFADDTIWLTYLLERDTNFNGWFHYVSGGQEVNTMKHFFLEPKRYSLEQRLFHCLHASKINSPTIKEFKESFAFMKIVTKFFGKEIDVVIDVAGGHGALGALLLVTTQAHTAVVVDPARVGNVRDAWREFLHAKDLRYRHECLRTALPDELSRAVAHTSPERILVVACHACQHLSDETVQMAEEFGALCAVSPCCQFDSLPGAPWKLTSKALGVPFATTMDLLLAGKSLRSYDVRMKFLDPSVTPQNRVLVCRPRRQGSIASYETHQKLLRGYDRAHRSSSRVASRIKTFRPNNFAAGFAAGVLLTLLLMRR